MSGPPRAVKLYGTEAPNAPVRTLRAGGLTCDFADGAVSDVRFGGVLSIRAISYLVRDVDWATPPAAIEKVTIEEGAESFHIRYLATVASSEVRYAYEATIEGSATDGLIFHVVGEALAPFLSSRCGFVVLHPMAGFAGSEVTIEHASGGVERKTVDAIISPSQPILDIRALTHKPAPGLTVTCRMEADLPHDPSGKFEMEDQRNWTDASFKTYVGSLLDPCPYPVKPGRRITQTVRVHASGSARAAKRAAKSRDTVSWVEATRVKVPFIGFGLPAATSSVSRHLVDLLKRVEPAHMTAFVDLADPDAALQAVVDAAATAAIIDAPIQLEIVLPCRETPDRELALAAELCDGHALGPEAVIACPAAYLKSHQPSGPWPDVPALEEIYGACREHFPYSRIGGGMLTFFTELNRKRPPLDAIDFITHTTAPIVHAADDRSVMETLQTLPAVTRSVAAMAPKLPYRLGPSAIGMRENPHGRTTMDNPRNARLAMAHADPRQRGLFAAAWTIGYAAAVAPARLEALTLNQATGPQGIVWWEADRPQPWFDTAKKAVVYPVFHAMRWLAQASGRPMIALEGLPDGVAGIGWKAKGKGGPQGAVANLSEQPVTLRLAEPVKTRVLDEKSFVAACCDPDWVEEATPRKEILLGAYAVALLGP